MTDTAHLEHCPEARFPEHQAHFWYPERGGQSYCDPTTLNVFPQLIGVCGRAYSGKDTLAEHLVAEFGYRRVGFADKVKEAVVALDPIVYVEFGSASRLSDYRGSGETAVELCNRLKSDVPEVRRLMQGMGNDVGQKVFGEHFWIDLALKNIQDGEAVVISDVRYPHEAEAIREVGGCVLRVTRPSQPSIGDHPSESLVDDCVVDADVVNDGSIQDYIAHALEALRGC